MKLRLFPLGGITDATLRALAALATDETSEALYEAAGVSASLLCTDPPESASFNSCWTDKFSVWPGGAQPPASQMDQYYCYPMYNVGYKEQAYVGDEWGSSGYEGETYEIVGTESTKKFSANFVKIQNGN